MKLQDNIDWESIDKGIRPAVKILRDHGFKTFASCEGGEGHAYSDPAVRFEGSEFDCIRAYKICQLYNLNVFEVMRVYNQEPMYENGDSVSGKEIGEAWVTPFNQITFLKSDKTGTIFVGD